MRSAERLLRQLLADAPRAGSLWLPKLEPHPAALIVGLGGVALGIVSARELGSHLLGWIGLSLAIAGMLMYATMLRSGIGWSLHFSPAHAEPVNLDGQGREFGPGEGWALFCIGGSGRRSLALEFRHVDGGKPLRVFQTRPNANRSEHQLTSQLADAIARRLNMGREGLTL